MIINKDKHAYFILTEDNVGKLSEQFYKNHIEPHPDKPFSQKFSEYLELRSLLSLHDDKLYTFSDNVQELSSKIVLDKSIRQEDYTFLLNINTDKKVYLLGNKFYKFQKIGNKINILMFTYENNYLQFKYGFILENRLIVDESFDMKSLTDFMRLLVFTELSETTEVYLRPNGGKSGTKKTGTIMNCTDKGIIFVKSNWNLNVNVSSFNVSWHLRLQPCGKNRSQRKLILIDSYVKDGYTLSAKKCR